MYCLNVAIGNVSWRLLYRDKDKAAAAFESLKELPIGPKTQMLEDDLAETLSVAIASVHGLMLEDFDKTRLAHVELALHQARTQNAFTKAAQADPGLRASSLMNGPAMLTPMGRQ